MKKITFSQLKSVDAAAAKAWSDFCSQNGMNPDETVFIPPYSHDNRHVKFRTAIEDRPGVWTPTDECITSENSVTLIQDLEESAWKKLTELKPMRGNADVPDLPDNAFVGDMTGMGTQGTKGKPGNALELPGHVGPSSLNRSATISPRSALDFGAKARPQIGLGQYAPRPEMSEELPPFDLDEDGFDWDTGSPSNSPMRGRMMGKPRKEGASGGVAGFQAPMGTKVDKLKEMIRQAVHEIVRKKEGGGGYVLYGPNKGKKKNPKPAGEFPTRLAAKRAELARFPPKDPEQLKKLRKRLDKLSKDPKKRAAAERADLTGRKPVKKSGAPARARKKATTESMSTKMAKEITERLFREEEIAGSPWDLKISNLTPDAVSSDKRLAALHKAMTNNSSWALDDAHKGLAKHMKGIAKVLPGDISHDDGRQKMYIPITLDVDGTEIGPIHFYVDGGHVKCEVSQEARKAITRMDPDYARDIRGSLMAYQEDALPKIDYARKAWSDRDSYLDKLHAKLDKHVGGMSAIEVHLAKQLLNKNRRR